MRTIRVLYFLNMVQLIAFHQIGYVSADILSDILPEDKILSSDISLLGASATFLSTVLPEDVSTVKLATKYGHPPIQYDVVTEDGYILTIYQLPGKNKSIPILLNHGLMDSSDTWLVRGPDSLAIALANDGFDVWLSNSRGNRYSRRHQSLNPDTDIAFWQFSFHEMGYYDLPAIINKILNKTGATNVTIIGHSQGNTMCLVLGSERPDYNSKVNVLLALAPIAYLHNARGPAAALIKLSPVLDTFANLLELGERIGDNSTFGNFLHSFCPTPFDGYVVCAKLLLFPIMGYDAAELEPSFYPIPATRFPAGSSVRSMLHFLQVGHKRAFARYNFGIYSNLKAYNSSEPPKYRLSRVTMPIALFAGRNDHLSTIPDVTLLKEQLPNVIYYLENPRSLINHMDYVWGRSMRDYLFPFIYHVLNKNNHYLTNASIESTYSKETGTLRKDSMPISRKILRSVSDRIRLIL